MNETQKNFAGTLAAGTEVERRIADHLVRRGGVNVRIVGQTGTKDWDILTDNIGTYEGKRDFRSLETGNHFLEHSYLGQPSGLRRTSADFYVLAVPTRLKVCRSRELREFVNKHKGAFYFAKNAGDDGKASGLIIPVHFFSPLYLVGYEEWLLNPPIDFIPGQRRQTA